LLAEALSLVAHPPIRVRGTIGGSLAHADPAAELPAVVAALDAELVLQRTGGMRVVPADEFFTGWFTTAIEPDELLTEIRLPALPAGTGTAFVEVARRHGDFALVGAAAVVTVRGGAVAGLRVALTGVSGGPVRVHAAEETATGQPAGTETFRAVANAVATELEPQSDLHAGAEYRRRVAAVVVERALARAADRAGGGR
jgi:carbon-monoxide dehydrogenase medium subunit